MEGALDATSMVATDSIDIGHLRNWYEEYTASDGNWLDTSSPVMRDIKPQHIDRGELEKRIEIGKTVGVLGGFCVDCLRLLDSWPDVMVGENYRAVPVRELAIIELEDAARNGCKFCDFLIWRLKSASLLETFRNIEERLRLLNQHFRTSLYLANTWSDDSRPLTLWLSFPGKAGDNWLYPVARLTGFHSHSLSPTKIFEDYPTDPFDKAIEWLRGCHEAHELCRCSQHPEWPSRLVSVAGGTVKVIYTSELKDLPRYGTLSYCWGLEKFTMLMSTNLSAFLHSVPMEELPPTLTDAIVIARRLKLDFIWIDALCIIQDDHTDWLRESSRMASVYGGSYVNIAASSARDVYEGCCLGPDRHNTGFLAKVNAGSISQLQSFYAYPLYDNDATKTPLASRGWAFQEKLLAPRTLHFGKQGLFWECRSSIASDLLPEQNCIRDWYGQKWMVPENEALDWENVVENYSRTKLTNSSDKLPALSGIARRQHKLTGDIYLAGLWKVGLVKQLGWEVVERRERPVWRAPTWSWASVEAPLTLSESLTNLGETLTEFVQVLDASTSHSDGDPFGQVTGGQLRLDVEYILRGRYWGLSGDHGKVILEDTEQEIVVSMDCLEDDIDTTRSLFMVPLFCSDLSSLDEMLSTEDTGDKEQGHGHTPVQVGLHRSVIIGIVLQQIQGTRGHFRRVGQLQFYNKNFERSGIEFEKDYHTFAQAMKVAGTSMAESEFAETIPGTADSGPRYVITIE